jgi:hypothetical protein
MSDDEQRRSEAAEQVTPICDAIDERVSRDLRSKAEQLAHRAERTHPMNRTPTVTAASAVYLAGLLVNEKLTQQTVADAAGVGVQSIRDGYRELFEHEGYGEGVELRDGRSDESGESGSESRSQVWQFARTVGAGLVAIQVSAVVAFGVFGLRLSSSMSQQVADNAPTLLDLLPAVGAMALLAVFIMAAMPYLPGMAGRGGRI